MVPQSPSGPTLAPCVVSEPGPSDTLIQRSLGTAQSTLLGFNGYGVRGRGEGEETQISDHSLPPHNARVCLATRRISDCELKTGDRVENNNVIVK